MRENASQAPGVGTSAVEARATQLYDAKVDQVGRRTDRMFAALMMAQWIGGIALASLLSPYSYDGDERTLHLHVYLAVFLGAAINVLPIALTFLAPARPVTRHVMAVAQMLWSALLIHLSGGRIEAHFHVFASLPFLAFYRDWRVLLTASVVVVVDHFIRGLVAPELVYGVSDPAWWRFVEHAGWVAFCAAFLIRSILQSQKEAREIAQRRAEAEQFSKTLERQIEERTAQLAEAQTIAKCGSWEWDLVKNQVTWSDELFRICGRDPLHFVPSFEAYLSLLQPAEREELNVMVKRALSTGAPFGTEHRVTRPSGEVRFIYARGRTVADATGAPLRMVGTVEDVTEQKELQSRLLFADRMSSVGTLAAGVAHEINNPLSYVLSNVDFARQSMPELLERLDAVSNLLPAGAKDRPDVDPLASWVEESRRELNEVRDALSEASDGALRVRNIVRDLKTLSRSDENTSTSVDVHAAIDSALKLAAGELKHRATIVREFGAVPRVQANESRLGQVFLNLLINAAHALPSGGGPQQVLIRTRTDILGNLVIEFRDTGCGIPEEIRGRIFDPFFTTKPMGEGTGLGLSICHGIIKAMKGEISVESAVGKGSTFRIVLPRSIDDQLEVVAPTSTGWESAAGRVLVLDDEPMVVAAFRRALGRRHQVVGLTSPREAVERIARGERFDAIVCDMMMPELTGAQVHAELLRIAPDQVERMIFVSGGAFADAERLFLETVNLPCLGKPFDTDELLAIIAHTSGAKDAASVPETLGRRAIDRSALN